MKRILIYSSSLFILLMVGCNDGIFIEEGSDLRGYGQVYIPQANNESLVKNILLDDNTYDLDYSAFYGGFDKAENDISVTFKVAEELVNTYNQKHGTAYDILPAACYELPDNSVIIPKGSNTSTVLRIEVRPAGNLEVFKTYILPVTIASSDAKVNENLRTVYFEVTVSYAKGEIPREKVLSINDFQGGRIISFVNGQLITKNPNNTLSLYTPDENGVFGTGTQIGQGFGFPHIFYFEPNRIVVAEQDLVQFAITSQGQFGAARAIGWGWNIFTKIIPYDKYLIGIRPTGLATSYEFTASGDLVGSNIRDIASNWNKYDLIFQYENTLLAREPNGNLSQIPMGPEGLPQAAVPRGTGWDMYVSVVASGNDLLALDNEGNVWRYKFVSRGNWQLK